MWVARADDDMFQRFTPRARRAIAAAHAHAKRLGSGRVEPEHLVLGAATADESMAALVESIGGTLEGLGSTRQENADAGAEAGDANQFTPAAKTALEAALAEVLRRGQAWIEPAHLLLGVLLTDENEVTVGRLGVSGSDLRAALEKKVAGIPFAILTEQATASAKALAKGRGQPADGGHLLEALIDIDPLVRMALEEELGVRPQRLAMAIGRLRAKQRRTPED